MCSNRRSSTSGGSKVVCSGCEDPLGFPSVLLPTQLVVNLEAHIGHHRYGVHEWIADRTCLFVAAAGQTIRNASEDNAGALLKAVTPERSA
jgi:hypothetical protein